MKIPNKHSKLPHSGNACNQNFLLSKIAKEKRREVIERIEKKTPVTLNEVKIILKGEPQDISEDRKIELEGMVLGTCPRAGQGVNNCLPFAKAIFDREPFVYKDETIASILTEAVIQAGRKPRAQEIERVIKNITLEGIKTSTGTSLVRAASIYQGCVKQQQWKLTPEECKGSQEKLCSLSSVKDPWELPTWEVLGRSYSSEDVLCFAEYKDDRGTSRLLRMRGISLYRFERLDPFMVPSPVLGKGAMTKEGAFSCRALGNFGERAYIITEFDSGSLDEQAAKVALAAGQNLSQAVYGGLEWLKESAWLVEGQRDTRGQNHGVFCHS